MIHLTHHAIERAVERIPGVQTEDQARIALSSTAIHLAIQIGAPFVKLGTGQHVVLSGETVVTVLPRERHLGTFTQARDQIHRRGM